MADHPFDLDTFVAACIEAHAFADLPEESPDAEFSPELLQRIRDDCASFLWAAWPYIAAIQRDELSVRGGDLLSAAGHDFALTRNGHGAGFWDGDWPKYGEVLTKIANRYATLDIYVGDDGKAYA